MAYFEVYIPARDAKSKNVALTVKGESWLEALRAGLAHIGEQVVSNIMCDIKNDGSIHVTDNTSGRVFRLREVPEPSSAEPAAAGMQPKTASGQFKNAPQPVHRAESQPTAQDPAIGRAAETFDVDEVIADIFERVMDLYTDRLNPDKIVNEILDLAIEKLPSDAGSFYVANISSHDLQFAAVRGPKATEILASGIRVPMGQGIAGFCAQESVSLAISDVQKDPRFAREISDKIGYEAHAMVCIPLDKDGRCYGAIQLINRQGGGNYTKGEVQVLQAIGTQAVDLLSQVQT